MNNISVKEEKLGLPFCVNCVGWHPDHMPDFKDYYQRMADPQKDAWVQHSAMKHKADLYRNKSCVLCGRTYDSDGALDETWALTAQRVKLEMTRAGFLGLDDTKIELIVARCRKHVVFLFENRMKLNPKIWERFTFGGCLATIITQAEQARETKRGGSIGNHKGVLR